MKMSDPKEVTPEPVPLAAEDDLTGVDLEVDELLGGAVGNEPSDDLNKELDLDELNDNLRDYLEDNLSLEVNFGDGSSCRASDDKLESGAGEERNSSRSVSSERDRASGIDSQDLSDGASETTPTAPESLHTSISEGSQSSESNTGSVQQRNSLEIRNNIPDINETKDYAKDSGEDRNKLQPVGAVPKIRKKSPGLARRLADSMQFEGSDRDTSSSERESEPAQIDTTVHSAQKDFETQLNTQLRCGSAPFASHPVVPPTETTQVPNGLGSKEKSSSFEKLCDSLLGNDPNGLRIPQDSDTSPDDSDKMDPSLKSMEVENEYDYIKYARIQHGDWYVGMRLAYSSSNDSLSAKRSISGGLRASDDEYLGSSREGSPEKTSQRQSKLSDHLSLSKVNEDTLTEIPLNGSDHAGNDEKNFSLSPEATECDSAEVESVLSDEGKSSTSGFPAVEDGLSSSQGSDTEDPIGPEMQTTPAELLKRRYKAEIEQELKSTDLVAFSGDDHQSMSLTDNSSLRSTPSHHSGGSGHDSSHGSEHHSSHSSHSHRHPPEVDAAIQDIKSAIKRSKHAALQHEESLRSGGQQEPIWVMRDSYVRKLGPGNNDIQRVHEEYESHGDDTIDLPQDGGYPVDEETDQYRDFENTDGKTFPSSKGFDSDDEVDDNRGIFNQTRRVKGKQYKALPEAEDDPPYSQHGNHRNLNARKQPNTLVSGPSAHSGTATTRTMGSVRASANNGISGTTDRDNSNHNKNDGVQNPHSFSSAIPHSRYRTVNPPQSQPHLSSSKSPTTAPLVDIGSSNSTSASGTSQQVHSHTDTGYTNPSRTSHSQPSSVTSDLRSQYSESDEEPRNRPRARRRYPSYEYHDDTDDEYYSDSDREPSTYVRRRHMGDGEYDTDEETDELLDKQYMRPDAVDIPELTHPPVNKSAEVGEEQVEKRRSRAREDYEASVTLRDPDNETVLIEGVLFRARYLGSTQLISEGQPSKGLRMMQAQEAVGRIKAPEGENQPSTEVDLFVSIEKIMVLNTDLQEIMMDHALRTISYIADIGDLLVIMARRGPVLSNDAENRKRQTKICCHVFESDEAQLIAQSIGQAFQVAYMEFLKANGIEDTSMFKEIDYQEVLNQQEIFGEELFLFSNKEMQKEVIVPKLKNEPLGVVIVESGWGSMVPTVVLANMSPTGAAARGGQLNIGDQIMSINGVSLVGLPLSSCQTYIKAAKHQTVVKLNVVSCAPVVEVCIKRPDVKYQLGFSVQNGVICSLLRGGIAERGGVRVGHRIIEINGESVVAVPHEKIVKMLATSVGEIHMKTMPTSIFRLLTGQDVPHYI